MARLRQVNAAERHKPPSVPRLTPLRRQLPTPLLTPFQLTASKRTRQPPRSSTLLWLLWLARALNSWLLRRTLRPFVPSSSPWLPITQDRPPSSTNSALPSSKKGLSRARLKPINHQLNLKASYYHDSSSTAARPCRSRASRPARPGRRSGSRRSTPSGCPRRSRTAPGSASRPARPCGCPASGSQAQEPGD